MAQNDAQSVKSAARILDVLEILAGIDRPISLAEVVAELGIPKSSALMLLRTLVSKGYVERDADGRYCLQRIFRCSGGDWVGGRVAVLRKLARPVMQDLALAVRETVVVGVLTPSFEVKVVEKVRSPREVRYDIEVGALYPAYCTAMGRAMLGFLDREVVEHYLRTVPRTRYTPKTTVATGALLSLLETVGAQGYAVNVEEHVDGASSVAAPLIDAGGRVLGSLNVGCVSAHFVANRESIIRHLLDATARLNQELARMSIRREEGAPDTPGRPSAAPDTVPARGSRRALSGS